MSDGYLEQVLALFQEGAVSTETEPTSAQAFQSTSAPQQFTIALKDPTGKIYQRTLCLRPGNQFFTKNSDSDPGRSGNGVSSQSGDTGRGEKSKLTEVSSQKSEVFEQSTFVDCGENEEILMPCFSQRPLGTSLSHQSGQEQDQMLSQQPLLDDGDDENDLIFPKQLPGTPTVGRQV